MKQKEQPENQTLIKHTDGVWSITQQHGFYGLALGTRMTIVQLANGKLWLHSPIDLSPSLQEQIRSLGEVEGIVCPNLFHHCYSTVAAQLFPQAKVYGVPGLEKKQPNLSFAGMLPHGVPEYWGDTLAWEPFAGTLMKETVFFHKASGTLITADLIENFIEAEDFITRTYLKVAGIYRQPGFSRLLRFAVHDRARARASLEKICQWPIQRMLVAHGVPLEGADLKKVLRQAYDWL